MNQNSNQSSIELRAKSGKYLTFKLGPEEYGIEILRVQEIIGLMSITKVPRLPDFIRGILNLRGKLIPVIEMRSRFGMESISDHDRTCIIVVQIPSSPDILTMGILVDSVSEVVNIETNELEPPLKLGEGIDVNFMLGIAKQGQKVILILDIGKILTTLELDHLEGVRIEPRGKNEAA